MKLKKSFWALFMLSGTLLQAQTWKHYSTDGETHIYQMKVVDTAIWVESNLGYYSKLDLQGNYLKSGTSDSLKLSSKLPNRIIQNGVLYYTVDHSYKKVKAPILEAPVVVDSKNVAYAMAQDTLWWFDGNSWAHLDVSPSLGNQPCSGKVAYKLAIDQTDKLWVTAICPSSAEPQNFVVNLSNKQITLAANNNQNHAPWGSLVPSIGPQNSKLLLIADTLYEIDENQIGTFKKKTPILHVYDNIVVSFPLTLQGVYGNNMIYYTSSPEYMMSYDYEQGIWDLSGTSMYSYYLSRQKDLYGDVWSNSWSSLTKMVNGVSEVITVKNDPFLLLCHQDTIKKYNTSANFGFDRRGKFWFFKTDATSGKPLFCIKPSDCYSDTAVIQTFGAIEDGQGALWKYSKMYSDPNSGEKMIVSKQVNGVFKEMYTYPDKDNPLLSINVADNSGAIWGICGINYLSNGKYDKYKVVKHDGTNWIFMDALGDQVDGLIRGKNDDIWVLTSSQLFKFDGSAWTSDQLPRSFNKGQIVLDGLGNIWYGNADMFYAADSVYRFDEKDWDAYQTPTRYSNMLGDPKAGVWVYEPLYGASYTVEGTTWYRYGYEQGLDNNYVWKVSADENGTYWFGLGGGIVSNLIEDPRIGLMLSQKEEALNDKYTMFPNPVSDRLYVKGVVANAHVSIYNTLGNLIYESEIENGQFLELSHLSQGMYLLKLQEQGSLSVRNFIKN